MWSLLLGNLLLFLDDLRSNSIHVGGSLLGKSLSSGLLRAVIRLVLDLADETGIFELFQAVSDNLSSSLSVVRWSSAISLFATVVRSQSRDAHLAAHVQLVCH